MRWAAAIALSLVLMACASTPGPVNAPLSAPPAGALRESEAGGDVLVLSLSGGGARAAAFELGALQALRDTRAADGRPLTAHIAFTTSVSGGAVLSAYYAQHGDAGLETFRAAYLDKDWRLNSFYAPTTWVSAVRGGANGPERLAQWLDAELYHGARMRDLNAGPRAIINATDLYNAAPFAFTRTFFDGICSDAGDVRIADAVAASMAVPLAFRPVLMEAYPERCAAPGWVDGALSDRALPETVRSTARAFANYRDASAQRYLHLADGGVFDNFGLASLTVMRVAGPPPTPFTVREAVQARRVLVLVMNAEYRREVDWRNEAAGPGGADALATSLDVATEAGKRGALDALRADLDAWTQELVRYRCGLSAEAARALGAGDGWDCRDVRMEMETISLRDAADAPADLIHTPTLVSLPRETVDALIAAGRSAARGNAAIGAFARP